MMRERLEALAPSSIEIIDDGARHAGHAGARSGGGHYRLRIVADAFAGKIDPARHRLVYQALGEFDAGMNHALAIDARSAAELHSQNQ